MKIELVEDWKGCWKWFSSWALTLAGAIPVVWVELPEDLKASIPPGAMSAITAVVAGCGLVGRLVNQAKPK